MKNEPNIVKQLREEEEIGLLQSFNNFLFEEFENKTNESSSSNSSLKYINKDSLKLTSSDKILQDVKQKYKTIFENYSVAITLVDNKERIVSWNTYAEELFNRSEKELFLAPVKSLYPDEEWKKIRKENVRQKGIKYRMETKMIRKDRGLFDVELSLCILKSTDGKTVGSVGIIRDITRLKKAERKLKESEDKYRTIFDNSAVAITISDEKERIVSWNKFAEDLLDMKKDKLFMKPVKTLYPQDEWNMIRSENVRQKGMQHCIETKMIKGDNKTINVCLSLSVIKNYKNNIIGSIGIIQDNTRQKNLESYLKRSEKKFRQLYQNAPIPYHTLSPKGIITNVNEKWCELLGYSIDEVIGKSIFDFIDKKEKNIAKSSFLKKIESLDSYTGGHERMFLTKTGEKRIFIIHDFLYYEENGNLEFVQTTMEDITDRKNNEEKLKESYDIIRCVNKDLELKVKDRTAKIENLLKQKDEFINQLGHDLKTPLTPLISLLPILERTETDSKSKEMLEVFHRNVDYMKNLVTKTIELARLNSPNTIFDISEQQLWEIVEGCIQDQMIIFYDKNIKITNKVDKNIFINADKLRLGELFNNLINNSIKYTHVDGLITIDANDEDNQITVSIQDNGIGMDKEQAANVFNEFYKADKSRHDFKSSGLGLSICKRIVEKHNGKIWVESPGLNKGSIFYFTLPKISNN